MKELGNIARSILAYQVYYRCADGRCLKAGGMAHHPTAHEPAIAPAHHTQALRIGVAGLYYVVHASHQVFVIGAAPITLVRHPEINPVAGRAPRVRPKNENAFFRKRRNGITTLV